MSFLVRFNMQRNLQRLHFLNCVDQYWIFHLQNWFSAEEQIPSSTVLLDIFRFHTVSQIPHFLVDHSQDDYFNASLFIKEIPGMLEGLLSWWSWHDQHIEFIVYKYSDHTFWKLISFGFKKSIPFQQFFNIRSNIWTRFPNTEADLVYICI